MRKFYKIEKINLLESLKNKAKSLGLSLKIIKDCPLISKCLCFKDIPCSKKQECFTKYSDKRKTNKDLSPQELNKLTESLINLTIQCEKAETKAKRRLNG